MDDLPVELVSIILGHIHDPRDRYKPRIGRFAILNQTWKEAVESVTFRILWIEYGEIRLFIRLFDGHNVVRRPRLQKLCINLRERKDWPNGNATIFLGLKELWQELGRWEGALRVQTLRVWLSYNTSHSDLNPAEVIPTSELSILASVKDLVMGTENGTIFPRMLGVMVARLPGLESLDITGQLH